jgi:hypothetical protein
MSLLNSALLGVGFSLLALACATAGGKPGQVQDNPDDYNCPRRRSNGGQNLQGFGHTPGRRPQSGAGFVARAAR